MINRTSSKSGRKCLKSETKFFVKAEGTFSTFPVSLMHKVEQLAVLNPVNGTRLPESLTRQVQES